MAECFCAAPSAFLVLEREAHGSSIHTNIDSYVSGNLYPQGNVHLPMDGGDSNVVRQITTGPDGYLPYSGGETPGLVVLGLQMTDREYIVPSTRRSVRSTSLLMWPYAIAAARRWLYLERANAAVP